MKRGRPRAVTLLFCLTAIAPSWAEVDDRATRFSEETMDDVHRQRPPREKLFRHQVAHEMDSRSSLYTRRKRIPLSDTFNRYTSNLFERESKKTTREPTQNTRTPEPMYITGNDPSIDPTASPVIRHTTLQNSGPVDGRYFYEPLVRFPDRISPPSTKNPALFPTNVSPSATLSPSSIPPSSAPSILVPSTKTPSTEPPTAAPTKSPSTEPPTAAPTKSPSTEPPTAAPTKSPSTEPPTAVPTKSPSTEPPTAAPTKSPSTEPPTGAPTSPPTPNPTPAPQPQPTQRLTLAPTLAPISPRPTSSSPVPITTSAPISPTPNTTPAPQPQPTSQPTPVPTESPTVDREDVIVGDLLSFQPGNFSNGKRSSDYRIVLSNGLSARSIAQAGQKVQLADGTESDLQFHNLPDAAAVFPSKTDSGWLYVSNAENDKLGTEYYHGGVGVLKFNGNGEVTAYYKIANHTKRNCGGGRTPWNSWVSCEEVKGGRIHQTDPYGVKTQSVTAMGDLGYYESFAYDLGTPPVKPTFYATRDRKDGVVTRFTPDEAGMKCFSKPNDYDRWCTLDSGIIDYLYLAGGESSGKVEWITDEKKAGRNAEELYPSSEGIDIHKGIMYFTSKEAKRLVIVNLRNLTYNISSTKSGAFNNQPDQVHKVLGTNSKMLLLCEDGGRDAGLHGRTLLGDYYTILYRDKNVDSKRKHEETTGLGVSPDFKHLYVSFQHSGIIYDVTRDDSRPVNGQLLDIKYHAMES